MVLEYEVSLWIIAIPALFIGVLLCALGGALMTNRDFVLALAGLLGIAIGGTLNIGSCVVLANAVSEYFFGG